MTAAARTATLDQLRERLESGEPAEKVARMTEEEQRFIQQAFQRNLFSMARQLPMKIKINGRGEAALALRQPLDYNSHWPQRAHVVQSIWRASGWQRLMGVAV